MFLPLDVDIHVERGEDDFTDQSLGLSIVEVIIATLTLQVGVLALLFGVWRQRQARLRSGRRVFELEATENQMNDVTTSS